MIIEFINGVPQTDKPLNGYYEVKKKQDRNGLFLAKYWKLLQFTAFHIPEKYKIEMDLSYCSKEMLHEVLKQARGVESVSFAKMTEEQFSEHYSAVLDQCCAILGTKPETVIQELTSYF